MRLYILNLCDDLRINSKLFLLFKICFTLFMILDVSRANTQGVDEISIKQNVEHITMKQRHKLLKCEASEQPYTPGTFGITLTSLDELQLQESLIRKKDKAQKWKMSNKVEGLMSNITKTLNGVDRYIAYEGIKDQKNDERESTNNKLAPKLVVKRMKEVDEGNTDVFVDSFVQQMYEMDPSILNKINDRIKKELKDSNAKKQKQVLSKSQPQKAIKRKVNLKSIVMPKEPPIYSDDNNLYDIKELTEMPEKLFSEINKILEQKEVHELLNGSLDLIETTTTPSTTTLLEGFYDYGDYYREDDTNKIRDMAHYEIVKDILQTSTQLSKYFIDLKKKHLKNRSVNPRFYGRKEEILKKRLKSNLKKYNIFNKNEFYNINYDYKL